MICKDDKMLNIIGGSALGKISGAIINAFSTIWKTIYGIGQGAGGAIRRIATGKTCKI